MHVELEMLNHFIREFIVLPSGQRSDNLKLEIWFSTSFNQFENQGHIRMFLFNQLNTEVLQVEIPVYLVLVYQFGSFHKVFRHF